jgi:hypothetical protein
VKALVVIALLAGTAGANELSEQPWLFSAGGTTPRQNGLVETEVSFGARSTRVFGDGAREHRLGGEARILPWLSVRLAGGWAFDGTGTSQGGALFSELVAQPLTQARHGVSLRVGAGYTFDYLERHVPTLRVQAARRFGVVEGTLGLVLDFHPDDSPFNREPVDITLTAVAAVRIGEQVRAGLELTASDLEGFVEEEEAEGGARIVVGPTLIASHDRFYARGTVAAIFYATSNPPVQAVAPTSGRVGVLGDLAVGLTF